MPKRYRYLDLAFLAAGIILLLIFTTVYGMPFRLDDVLHMDWAREHSFWDAFDPARGEIVRSYRPLFAATIWILYHSAGTDNYFVWHLTLVGSFLIGLAYSGLTARYLSQEKNALFFSCGLYWLAFLPILNVLFWFGDLTYSIELMFTAPAWYYGLRGILERRIGLWTIGCLLGACAVLSKEPAIVLVHLVYGGIFLLSFKEIGKKWRGAPFLSLAVACGAYLVLCIVTLQILVLSPTRSNRFFVFSHFNAEEIRFFILDRYRYYSENLLPPLSRLIIGFPLVFILIESLREKYITKQRTPYVFVTAALCVAVSYLFVHSLVALSALLLVVPFLMKRGVERKRALFLLPFSLAVIIVLLVLLVTVMLVKTQLTELSVVLAVIIGSAWASAARKLSEELSPYLLKKRFRLTLYITCSLLAATVVIIAAPILGQREQLLDDVRDVRFNANDAIKWMSHHLPDSATVLLASPRLYGIARADDLTSREDEVKLYSQYTFLQGYVRSYFKNLGRFDLKVAYLEDSTTLDGILHAFRESKNSYLFLQTGLDHDRFHSLINGKEPLTKSDSMLVSFERGKYPCEIWQIMN